MPPKKAKGSVKTETKKKEKIIEDKTFGLKNKNRSKAVQKYVQTVTNSVKQGGQRDLRAMELEREKKKMEKEEKKKREQELKKMYGGVEDPKKAQGEMSASAAAAAERGEYLWTADDFDEVEADETRLEEQLEAEREALVGRTDLTPVNEESFQAWWKGQKEKKRKEDEKAAKKAIKAFKQTGRGITGRQLFEHDASVFVDDANANEEYDREDDLQPEDAAAEDENLFDGEDLPDDEEEEDEAQEG